MSAGAASVRRAPTKSVWLLLISLLLSLALHQAYLTRAYPDAVYMDSLRLLSQLSEWQRGQLSSLEFWNQGQHRGLVFQAALLANVEWFSLDPLLANRMTGFAILALSGWLGFAASGAGGKEKATPLRLSLACLIPLLLFSWAGFELLTLDLGWPLWGKNLLVVAYFALHACSLRRALSGEGVAPGRLVLLTVTGVCLVLLIAMGWSYAFVGAVLGVQMLVFAIGPASSRRRIWSAWPPAAGLIVALLVYVAIGSNSGTSAGMSLAQTVSSLLRALALLPDALGSTWIGLETVRALGISRDWLWVFGMASLLLAGFGVLGRWRRGLASNSLLPLYLLAYGVLTAFSICVARGGTDPAAVGASRYYMDFVLFQVGMLWLLAEQADESPAGHGRLAAATYVLACVLVLAGQLLTYRQEWKAAPYRKEAFAAMNRALLAGVPDAAAAQLLQAPLEDARLGAKVMRERYLGAFVSLRPARSCDPAGIRFLSGWHQPEPGGVWMSGKARLLIPACACTFEAKAYVPSDFGKRRLRLSDPFQPAFVHIDLPAGATTGIRLPGGSSSRAVEINIDRIVIPARDLAGGRDVRELGAFWSQSAFACGVGAGGGTR